MEQWIKKQNFSSFPIDFEELEFILSELVEEVLDLENIDLQKPLELTFNLKFDENGELLIDSIGNKFASRSVKTGKPVNLAQISEKNDFVTLTIDLPALKEDELRLKIRNNKLIVLGAGMENFRKEFFLTAQVEPKIVSQTFKNGILEVMLKKQLQPIV